MIAGLEIGADEFLCKPVYQEELLARMCAGSRVLELERRLSLMAHTDPLTGLMTQRTFYEILEKEWHRAKRYQLPISCVMLDLDFFKQVNDIHGHQAGDSALKSVADVLLESSRSSDSVCRYGGEEFCILLPEANEIDASGLGRTGPSENGGNADYHRRKTHPLNRQLRRVAAVRRYAKRPKPLSIKPTRPCFVQSGPGAIA